MFSNHEGEGEGEGAGARNGLPGLHRDPGAYGSQLKSSKLCSVKWITLYFVNGPKPSNRPSAIARHTMQIRHVHILPKQGMQHISLVLL